MTPAIIALLSCMPTENAYGKMTAEWSEQRLIMGMSRTGGIVEMWTGKDGAWTLVLTMPDGQSCLIDVGEGAMIVPQGDPA